MTPGEANRLIQQILDAHCWHVGNLADHLGPDPDFGTSKAADNWLRSILRGEAKRITSTRADILRALAGEALEKQPNGVEFVKGRKGASGGVLMRWDGSGWVREGMEYYLQSPPGSEWEVMDFLGFRCRLTSEGGGRLRFEPLTPPTPPPPKLEGGGDTP